MAKSPGFIVLLGLLALGMGMPSQARAVTLSTLGFDEIVQQAAVIVHGRVTKVESFWGTGQELAKREGEKESQSPARQTVSDLKATRTTPEAPIGVGTRGGRMIFTRVTLDVISPIKGVPGKEVEFVIAGGALDGRSVVIPGMPEFQGGGVYMVFLRQGNAAHAAPIVGVNQGFFQVVRELESGQDVVLNANADYVIAIEENRVIARRNAQTPAQAGHPRRQLTSPPVPDTPAVRSQTSAEVERYWNSTEAPMTVHDIVQVINGHLGR